MGKDEIDALLSGKSGKPADAPTKQSASPPGGTLSVDEIEAMISGEGSPRPTAQTTGDHAHQANTAAGAALPSETTQAATANPQASPAAAARRRASSSDDATIQDKDIELLLNQAESALASVGGREGANAHPGVRAFQLDEFSGQQPSEEAATLDLIRDVELNVRIELGRTHMYLEDVLKLHKGSVVPLDKLAGDPVDIYVNGRLIARGEVLVLNDNFCVRVAELIAGEGARAG
ncbi:MAG: flagellar motor switch protein FliN [Planctomycetales bacterium]|nr:flagellar motor switch protein FliN [Planctomycetales bacterium]